MSGPQHLAWYETARREVAHGKLRDLTVVTAPYLEHSDFIELRERLIDMSKGR